MTEIEKKVLVTGGAGFIGSHLCEYLLDKGYEVYCIDNLGSGNRDNVKHLEDNEKFKFMNQDITSGFYIGTPIDQIYHLASRASPLDYQKYPVETALSNSIGTNNMANLAKAKNATLLFTSTSEAYGEPKEHPQKESYWGNVNPVGVRSCYDESKRFGEALLMAYKREYDLDVKIVRIFNTYGPKMRKDDGRVIPNFITQALKDESLTIYGDGSQTRSFCYVDDMVRGLVMMMESDHVGPKNLGNPKEMTVKELADTIIEMTNSKSKITYRPLPVDDPTRRRPDISEARKLLGWDPEILLKDGLEKTIKWFKDNGV